MAKTRTNKNSKSKNTNKTRRSKTKQDNKPFLIFAILFVILMIVGYFILGLLFTVFMGVGILIIVGIAKLVDKTNISEKNIYKIISTFQEKAGTTMKEASTVIAGQALAFANSAKNIGLKFANNINADEVVYGTLCCELGAEANYEKMENEKSANIETVNVAKQPTVTDKDSTALNTALTVMTSDMIEDKTQRSVIAILAMCSTNFTEEEITNKEAWNNNINEISAAVEEYNKNNNTNYTFDVDAINELINDETEFARIQNEVTAIKEGMTIENS